MDWMERDPRVVEALRSINFLERYKDLTFRFHADSISECLEYFERDWVLKVFDEIGWGKARYFKGERFYRSKIITVGEYKFYCNVDLLVPHFSWTVFEGDKCLLGSPTAMYYSFLGTEADYVGGPDIRSDEDLVEILRVNFEMFSDFVEAFLKIVEREKTC